MADIKSILYRGLNIGVNDQTSPDDTRIIRLINGVVIFSIFHAIFNQIATLLTVGYYSGIGFQFVAALLFYLTILFMNSRGLMRFSRVVYVIYLNLAIYTMLTTFDLTMRVELILLVSIALYAAMFKKKSHILIYSLFTLTLFIVGMYLQIYGYIVPLTELTETELRPTRLMFVSTAAFSMVFIAMFFKTTAESYGDEFKKLNQIKNRFFANISHEIRTPLTVINASLSQIKKHQQLDQEGITNLQAALNNVEQLEKQLNEILMLSKLEAGKVKLHRDTIDLQDFIKNTVNNLIQLAKAENIQLNFISTLSPGEKYQLDQEKLRHILSNLLSNAIKFTPPHGHIIVKCSLSKEKNLHLEVSDTGRGIAKEDLPYIFDRYFQTSNEEAPAEGGTGIGLALVKEFVELMGGKIKVASEVGIGTSFFLTFPVAMAKNTVEKRNIPVVSPRIAKVGDQQLLSRNKILVVEDNSYIRNYLTKILSEQAEVHALSNGQLAWEYLQQNQDENLLILSDLMMPVMDGISLLQKVKSEPKLQSIPFIMLTARADQDDQLRALRIGVDDYLIKPFVEEELFASIHALSSNFVERQKERKKEEEYLDELPENNQTATSASLCPSTESIISPAKTTTDQQWLCKVETLVLDLLTNPQFSVDFLAEQAGISRRQLYRKIKLLTGLTPNHYIREVRLQKAKTLLENQAYPTPQAVCKAVGFHKFSYFSNLYKDRFGKHPAGYYGF